MNWRSYPCINTSTATCQILPIIRGWPFSPYLNLSTAAASRRITKFITTTVFLYRQHSSIRSLSKKGESLQRQVLESYAKPKKVIAVPNFSVYHQLLENSPYLSFSRLSSSLEFSIESVSRKAIPFKEDIRVYFGYIYRTDRELSPLMQEFLDYTLIYCKHHYGD